MIFLLKRLLNRARCVGIELLFFAVLNNIPISCPYRIVVLRWLSPLMERTSQLILRSLQKGVQAPPREQGLQKSTTVLSV
jgi:hypothetical protein